MVIALLLSILTACGGGGAPAANVIVTPTAVTISFQSNNYFAVRGGADANLVLEITDSDGNSAGAPTDYTFNLTASGAASSNYEIYDGATQIAGGTDPTPEIAEIEIAAGDTSKTLRIVAVGTSTDPLKLQFPDSTDSDYQHSTGQTDIRLLASPPLPVGTFYFQYSNHFAVQGGDDTDMPLAILDSDGNLVGAPTDYTFGLIASGTASSNYEIYDGTTLIAGRGDPTPEIAEIEIAAGDTITTLRIVAVGTSPVQFTLRFPDSTNPEYLHSTEQTNVYLLTSSPILTFSPSSIVATEGDADVTATLNLNPAQTLYTDIPIFSNADYRGDIELLDAITGVELPPDPFFSDGKILTVPAGATSVNFIIRFVADSTYEETEINSLVITSYPSYISLGTVDEIALSIIDDGSVPSCMVVALSYNGTSSCSEGPSLFSVNMDGYLELDGSIESTGGDSISITTPRGDIVDWTSNPTTTDSNENRIWTLDSICRRCG